MRAPQGGRGWYVAIVAVVLIAIGTPTAAGGLWLLLLGGSFYYLPAGLGLIAAGVLMLRGSALGVWVYVGLFVLTLAWAFWEVGLYAWGLVPRVFAPGVLLVLVLLAYAAMRGRSRALLWPAGGVAVVAAVFLVAAFTDNPYSSRPGDLPQADATLAASLAAQPAALTTGADWPVYGGTNHARKYSPLAQITPENVGRLERAWVYHTGDLPSAEGEKKYAAETTPLKIGDSLYLCSAMNVLIALDPATGREKWRFDPQVSEDWIPYSASCRGVAYYEAPQLAADAPCRARIIEGTLDGRLVAVDARTGRPCPDFGTNGQADVKAGLGPVEPGMYAITSPPVIVRGIVVTGAQVTDNQRNEAPSGVIHGFDAVTGERVWAWDMAQPGWSPDPPQGRFFTRGTPNSWSISSSDEQLGLVYLPLGNSSSDYWSSDRSPVENRYTDAVVALDATTGRPRWYFRTVNMDVWDYDLGSQPTLVQLAAGDGGSVPAMILASKQGDIYVLDRRTGRPLYPVEHRSAPIGGVEPGQRTRVQPFSTYHSLAFPPLEERDMWGMSPLDQLYCRIQFRRSAYDGMYTPPTTDRRYLQYPGYNGGNDWGGIAIDPVRGVIVANYNDMPNYNRLIPREVANKRGWAPIGEQIGDRKPNPRGEGGPQWGVPYAIDVNAGWRLGFTGLLCKQPPYGGIRAIELSTGRTIWDRPFGTARSNGPFGIPSMLPFTIGTPNNGGPIVTRGGLIFISAATDNLMRAIDMRTGETLWSDVLPAGGQATPMTYEADGRQFVVIMAGGHHFMETPIGDELVAYALPEG